MLPEPALVALCQRHLPALQAVYGFGSCFNGQARPESDLDLALLLPPGPAPAQPLALTPLYAELCRLSGRPVDLIDLRRASTVLAVEVLRSGRRLQADDLAAADLFEAQLLTDYQRLNLERREVLRAFADSGKAYAV